MCEFDEKIIKGEENVKQVINLGWKTMATTKWSHLTSVHAAHSKRLRRNEEQLRKIVSFFARKQTKRIYHFAWIWIDNESWAVMNHGRRFTIRLTKSPPTAINWRFLKIVRIDIAQECVRFVCVCIWHAEQTGQAVVRVFQPVSAITTAQPTECRNTNRASVRIWVFSRCSWPHCMDTLRMCSTLKIHTKRCGGYAHMFGVRCYRVMNMFSVQTHFTRTCPARSSNYFHVHHPNTHSIFCIYGRRSPFEYMRFCLAKRAHTDRRQTDSVIYEKSLCHRHNFICIRIAATRFFGIQSEVPSK